MKKTTKLLSLLLMLGVIFGAFIALSVTVSAAEVASGTTGDVSWTLTDDGTLTFSGEGAMADYSNGTQPWYAHKDSIKTVIVTKGVTSISTYAFYEFPALATVKIAGSVTAIGSNAFAMCSNLSNVEYYGSSAPVAGSSVFFGSYVVVKVPSSYSGDVFCETMTKATLDAANEPLPPCDHAGHTQTGCTACGATDESIHSFVSGTCSVCGAACTHDAYDSATGMCGTCDELIAEASVSLNGGAEVFYMSLESALLATKTKNENDKSFVKVYNDVDRDLYVILNRTVTLDLNGHTVRSTGDLPQLGIDRTPREHSEMTIIDSGTGGKLIANTGLGNGIVVSGGSKLTVLSGSIIVSDFAPIEARDDAEIIIGGTAEIISKKSYGVDLGGDNITMSVTGGSITGDKYSISIGTYTQLKSLKISGGTIKGAIHEWTSAGSKIKPVITGGSFPEGIEISGGNAYLSLLLGDGYVYYVDGVPTAVEAGVRSLEGNVTVKLCDHSGEFDTATGNCAVCGKFVAVASLSVPNDLLYFETLEDAVAAAQQPSAEGSTVTLLDDVQLSTTLYITAGKFILDLNGKTISNAEDASFSSATMIEIDGTDIEVMITDSSAGKTGTITSDYTAEKSITVSTISKLIVKNGTIKNTATDGVAVTSAILGGMGTGYLVVENGTFVGQVSVWGNSFEIRGGSFESLKISRYVTPSSGEGLMGGSFDKIFLNTTDITLADTLAKDHYLYGSDGRFITPADETEFKNVTVKCGADISTDAVITVNKTTYNGTVKAPSDFITVTVGDVELEYNVDYTVSLLDEYDYTTSGDHPIMINGIGNYTGGVEKDLIIEKATPTPGDFTGTFPTDLTYNGEGKSVIVTVIDGIVGMGEITVTYLDADLNPVNGLPTNAGYYTVKISVAEGTNYTAKNDLFTMLDIFPFTLGDENIVMSTEEVTYNRTEQKPEITVVVDGKTLVLDKDYTLTWNKEDFEDAGTYTATVEGIGNYQGTVNKSYVIKPKPILDSDISIYSTEETYSGGAYFPTVSVKDGDLWLSTGPYGDFDVVWDKDGFVDAGTYTATITGKNNYSGSFTRTFVIKQAEFELEFTSPITSVLPGNQIALTLNTNSDATPTWILNNATVVSGTVIKVDDGLIIGQDTVTVTVTYAETTNVKGGTKTITLEVGMSDFSGDIADLENDIAELNDMIENKADADDIAQKLTELANRVNTLENNAATYDALAAAIVAAKSELTTAYNDAVETAVSDLETKIAAQIDPTELAAEIKKVTDLIDALDDTYATDAKLAEAITKAENELKAAVSTLETKLGEEVEKLQNQITSNDTDIADIKTQITTVNGLIDALEAADVTLDGKITAAIDKAKSELDTAKAELEKLVADVQTNLDNAKAELDKAIADLDAAMKKGDADLSNEIANLNTALTDAKAALEKADADNKAELTAKIEEADTALDTAIKAVQTNLDNAKAELDKAIADGDTALDGKITKLNDALTAAKSALEAADKANLDALTEKIESADKTIESAIKAVEKSLADAKAELEAKDKSLQTFTVVVCVISSVALLGSGSFVTWFFIDRKKRF